MADFTTNQQTSTSSMEFLVAKTIDTVLNFSPVSLFFLGRQKPWKGTQMRIPIKYAQNTQGMWFDGNQKFSTTKTNNFVNMTFSPTGREINNVITQIEVDVNEPTKVMDIVARQLASDAQDAMADIASAFYTQQSGISFLSLIDAIDDGTTVASYGGLARSTYSGLKANLTTSVGLLTLANLRTSFNNAVHGADTPDLLVCPKAVWAYAEKLFNPTIQHSFNPTTIQGYPMFTGAGRNGAPNLAAPGQQLHGVQGFAALYYNGKPLIADEVCPSGTIFGLNTRSIAFYGLPSRAPGYKPVKFYSDTMDSVYNVPQTNGFSFSGHNWPVDQYARIGHIILMGNLICDNPRLNFQMTGITGA